MFTNLNIKRNQIVKWSNLNDAFKSLDNYTRQHFVILGDCDDLRPYWVVSASVAQKLTDAGYERA